MNHIDFDAYEALTFDCYGTLIDWERGILDGLRPVLADHRVDVHDKALLELFARHEAALEAGEYLRYRDVLAGTIRAIATDLGFEATDAQVADFSGSVERWPKFADSTSALSRLQERFSLGVITNCDDDLFAASNRRLEVEFDWIITAQQARSYKPARRNFELAFEQSPVPRDRILHVAQSLFHDHVPAKDLGMTTVWIDRRRGRGGLGATPPAADVRPDLEFADMSSFADRALDRALAR